MFPNTEQAEVYSDINNYLTRLYSIYYLLSMGRWLAVAYKRQHLKCEVTFRFVEFFPASFTSHPLPSVWTRQADLLCRFPRCIRTTSRQRSLFSGQKTLAIDSLLSNYVITIINEFCFNR